jgi:Nucleotide-binding protein implicated in inhibition of septum formation
MKKNLYLGSKSASRKMLLKEAGIPFIVLDQSADEAQCDWALPLEQVVLSIALYKMEHVVLPIAHEGDEIVVLTADTLSENSEGKIEGKPEDMQDAILKIKAARAGSRLCTAFCLDKKKFINGAWVLVKRITQVVHAEYEFMVPDESLDAYFTNVLALNCANAIAIEGYGNQFLRRVNGSYSTIVGLPMFELREALGQLGF